MKKTLLILWTAAAGITPVHADTWACPGEKDYFSQNRLFVAHVTPAEKDTKAKLEVFEIKDAERVPLWDCNLGNEGQPQDVFVSHHAKYVVTINECSGRVHGGMGDYVLAFYDRAGLIRNYSLEQILHYPEEIDKQQFRKLAPRTVSGRGWAAKPMFLDEYGDELFFCVWLLRGGRWLAWEVTTGSQVEVNKKFVERWNEKGRRWARESGIKSNWAMAAEFLGRFRRPEDRAIIETLLADNVFHTGAKKNRVSGKQQFLYYYAYSLKRDRAERILAKWDDKPAKTADRSGRTYYCLGVVEGTISLPRPPQAGDRWLCIYLIPEATPKETWYSEVPVHRLTAYFGEYSFHNCTWPGEYIPFRIRGVTPGRYWVKAVWDKAKPYNFDDNHITGPPKPGDYESLESPVITVEAGETTADITIDCTAEVISGTD